MNNFRKSCVYQIYPKSFLDTTGDGTGDINGITKKLDYLKELGVDYLWLTPFFLSPQNDNGYDIQDYYKIDPIYGTMEDLERLIQEADKRGMGLMFDMVFNHTSTYHQWFQKALQGDKKYQDYYFFKKGNPGEPPTNWVSKFGGNVWEYVEDLGMYYLHLFDRTQADLNWDNPEVREEISQILHFWKNKGVRGFRFDVINLISKPLAWEDDEEGDGRRFYTDGPRVHEHLREMVENAGLDQEDIITVGEMSSTTIEHCIRYTKPEEKQLKMCFHFHHLKVDYKDGDKWSLMDYDFKKLRKILHTWQTAMAAEGGWEAVFWNNHDQPRAVSRFGDDVDYLKESAKMLATVIHGMRGTPYVYQGEEIGMTNAGFTDISQYKDVESIHYYDILKERGVEEAEIYNILRQRSRDNSRTPMQWCGETQAGFTSGTPWIGVNSNYNRINAEADLADSDSIFYYYKNLISLRKEYDVISDGTYEPVFLKEEGVFGYMRQLGEKQLLVAANFTGEKKTVKVDLPEGVIGREEDIGQWDILIANYDDMRRAGRVIELPAYGAVMLYKN